MKNTVQKQFNVRYKKSVPLSIYGSLFILIEILSYFCSGALVIKGTNLTNYANNLKIALSKYGLCFWKLCNSKTPTFLEMGLLAWIMLCCYISYNYRNYHIGSEHGVENWSDNFDVNKRRSNHKDEKLNRHLTRDIDIALDGEGKASNNNMLVVGASGTYKTTSVVYPNILTCRENIIGLDVKGELLYKTGLYLKSQGVNVNVLDLKNADSSMRFNPFKYVEGEEDLIALITGVYDSLTPTNSQEKDPFWKEGVKLYLQSVFYYEWFMSKLEKRPGSINNVIDLINEENDVIEQASKGHRAITKLSQKIDDLKNNTLINPDGIKNPAVRDYYRLKAGATETVRSIIIMVNAKLKLLSTKGLEKIFDGQEENEINLLDFATGVGGSIKKNPDGTYTKNITNKKSALFICVDDQNTDFHFVASMLYDLALRYLCRIADEVFRDEGGKLPIPLCFWLDEFYRGARPHDVVGQLGIIRSRNISLVPILQSQSQIATLFPGEEYKTLMDNCSVFLFLGCGRAALDTQKFISELLGQMTADKTSDTKNGMNISASHDKVGISLMTPQEIGRIPHEYAIVFIEGELPIYDRKRLPWEDGRYLKKGEKSPYIEAMKINKNSKYGGYVSVQIETLLDDNTKIITKETSEREVIKIIEAEKEIEKIKEQESPKIIITENDLMYMNIRDSNHLTKEEMKQFTENTKAERENKDKYYSEMIKQIKIIFENKDKINDYNMVLIKDLISKEEDIEIIKKVVSNSILEGITT